MLKNLITFHLVLKGTSSLHDWEMESRNAQGLAEFILNDNKLLNISNLKIMMPVATLKSGKMALDKNAYNALYSKQYPDISFELLKVESITDKLIKARGMIYIAGTNRNIKLDVSYRISNDSIWFKGSIPIKFTQFEMEPPKALFGTITTGNDLVISFETLFISKGYSE